MKFSCGDLLSHIPFLAIERNKVMGMVTDIHHNKHAGYDVVLKVIQNQNELHVLFSEHDCTPYAGDLIEVEYQNIAFLLFAKSRNNVVTWSRKSSQIRGVHNTVQISNPDLLLGALSAKE
jgi:hypothetical protein